MLISEIYQSVQGEGFLTGTKSVFVRTSGCNLRCWFCDTPFASHEPTGTEKSVEDIVRQVCSYGLNHLVLTGGEPLLIPEIVPLCERFHEHRLHITIETAATLPRTLPCDLMSISPKLSNSTPRGENYESWRVRHDQARHAPEAVRQLIQAHQYQLKFVVDDPSDLNEIDQYLHAIPEIDIQRVMLMPQGTDQQTLEATQQWLEPYCNERGFHFCPRKQIEWFGSERGT